MRRSQPSVASEPQNIINHIGLVLDRSSSMTGYAGQLVKVADAHIEHLARRSQELNQETRISVWTFADTVECVVWDMDVLRLPSIAKYYRPYGNTAFIEAGLQCIRDLSETPERYGDHSFLVYLLTDGEENASYGRRPADLAQAIKGLPDHWTMAALVPNAKAVHEAKRFGFPAGNIETWDASSAQGVTEVVERIRQTTDAYMTSRASGVRSTTNLFSTDASAVNAATIQQAGLKPLAKNTYMLVVVPKDTDIKSFTEACGQQYKLGRGYYELGKRETIQPQKEIAIVERRGAQRVFTGRDARQMIGLPDMEVRVSPDYNPDYAVFVQSTSINRKLIAGSRYLYLI